MTTTYDVTVTREGKWWMVHIPDLDGLTQARRLAETGQMAREWIALTLGVPIADVAVNVTVGRVGPVDVAGKLDEIRKERAKAAALERRVAEESAALAKALADEHVPVRDIGAALGVSFQRAHQLVRQAAA
jgi:predicted RNase H-like HicB family nuclease